MGTAPCRNAFHFIAPQILKLRRWLILARLSRWIPAGQAVGADPDQVAAWRAGGGLPPVEERETYGCGPWRNLRMGRTLAPGELRIVLTLNVRTGIG